MSARKNTGKIIFACAVLMGICGCSHKRIPTSASSVTLSATYRIVNNELWVNLLNKSDEDVLLEIPSYGIEYSLVNELADESLDVKSNIRSVGIFGSTFKPLKKRLKDPSEENEQLFTSQSSWQFQIPELIDHDKIAKVQIYVRVIPIADLQKYPTPESLERAFLTGEQTIICAPPKHGKTGGKNGKDSDKNSCCGSGS